jgi:hypothetical protein
MLGWNSPEGGEFGNSVGFESCLAASHRNGQDHERRTTTRLNSYLPPSALPW